MKEILTLLAWIGMAGAAALFVILSVGALLSGKDYRRKGDQGAALVCTVTGIFMAILAVVFGYLTTKVIF